MRKNTIRVTTLLAQLDLERILTFNISGTIDFYILEDSITELLYFRRFNYTVFLCFVLFLIMV